MERLKERAFAPGSLEAEASELLRASGPYEAPSGLKRRVRERLLEGRARSWLPVLVRPTLAAAGVLLIVGAAAAVGRAVLARGEHAVPPTPAHQTSLPLAPLAVPNAPAAQAAPVAAQLAEPVPALAPDVAIEPAAAVDARRAAADRELRAAEASAQTEATLVYGAAKALRNSGDPALAAKLLDDYSRRYPHGALAEEALALSIDVAVARGDGRAKQLATRYLGRYPHGHFQVKAERVLGQ